MEYPQRIVIAGANGNLGRSLLRVGIKDQGLQFRCLVRTKAGQKQIEDLCSDIRIIDYGNEQNITQAMHGMDYLISAIKPQPSLSNYEYNRLSLIPSRLLKCARSIQIKQSVFISHVYPEKFGDNKRLKWLEDFLHQNISFSDILVCRTTLLFHELYPLYAQARSGRVFVFGNGEAKINPIHSLDLAKYIIDHLGKDQSLLSIGGPQQISWRQMSLMALSTAGFGYRIISIPPAISRFISWLLQKSRHANHFNFVQSLTSTDFISKRFGDLELKQYFENLRLSNI